MSTAIAWVTEPELLAMTTLLYRKASSDDTAAIRAHPPDVAGGALIVELLERSPLRFVEQRNGQWITQRST